MNLELIEKIKRITLIALVSDDILMDKLVLKGGNAINLIYNLSNRASIDLDYAMKGDFTSEELTNIEKRISTSLNKTFQENGYALFDFKFFEKPEIVDEQVKHFWGGYSIEFKIIEIEKYENQKNIEELRRNALVIGRNNSTRYLIEISKYEFVEKMADYEIDGYTLHAYTPEMIISEKIRALCQQVDEYKEIVKTMTSKSRARDFFDIYILIKHFKVDLTTVENIELLKHILAAKKVPVTFLSKIKETKELHESSFAGLRDTLKAGEKIESFDHYFEHVTNLCNKLVTRMKE